MGTPPNGEASAGLASRAGTATKHPMALSLHQYVSALSWGDAVGNLARAWQAAFRSWGHSSEIYAGLMDERSRTDARPSSAYAAEASEDAVLLIHHSFESREMSLLERAPGRKAVVYHNVTPASFFEGQDARMARSCLKAREELQALSSFVETAYAFSRFSAEELTAAGFENPTVVPFALDFERLDVPPDTTLLGELSDGCANVLFVGRAVPNKRLEDVVRAFTAYQRLYQPRSRLIVAGEWSAHSPYVAGLRALMAQLKPERVLLLGRVTQAQLSACYAKASAYVSMSCHEGFGVPLIEAMHHGVPVLAYGAAAVPETLGGAGVCTLSPSPEEMARLLAVFDQNPEARARLLHREKARAVDFSLTRALPALRDALAPLLAPRRLHVTRPPPDLPGVTLVAPLLDAQPEAPLSVAARSLAVSLGTSADVQILTLKAEGRPSGNGPEVQNEGLVSVLKYTPETPFSENAAPPSRSSSLEMAVRVSKDPVIFFDSGTLISRALLPEVQARSFAVDVSTGAGNAVSTEAQALGVRRHLANEAGLQDAVEAVAAQVLARLERRGSRG